MWQDRARALFECFSPAVCRAAAYASAVLVAAPFPYHSWRGSPAFLGLLEDDYFYYSIVADKFVDTGRLTYDGVTTTNGFHPLWFLVILAVRSLFGRFGAAFYVALSAIFVASSIATYELGRRFARTLGATPLLAPAIAAAYSMSVAKLLSSGMEATLAVPLLLVFLIAASSEEPLTPRRAARLGFLASLAVLARLDIAVAVGLLVAGWIALARPTWSRFWSILASFSAGGVLVGMYAISNLAFFGSVLPVSALAKHLITRPGFSIRYLSFAARYSVFGSTIAIVLPLGALAFVALLRRGPKHAAARLVGGSVLAFTALYFTMNATTGWAFFGWYAYPFAAATLAALSFIAEWTASKVWLGRAVGAATFGAAVWAPVSSARYFVTHGPLWSIEDDSMVAMSFELKRRLGAQKGLFSMGAIAGIATYVVDKPVFQLEGIISNKTLLEHLRHQDSLNDVLAEYGVDYLVVSLAYEKLEKREGCYTVNQPMAVWAGERSAKMHGSFCFEPILRFVTPAGPHPWSIFPELETAVFDVRGGRR